MKINIVRFKIIFTILVSLFFGMYFFTTSESIGARYPHSAISKILPLGLIMAASWILFIATVFMLIMMLKNIDFAVKAFIVYLPMSALPYILLGYPQVWINHIFMCRSSVVLAAFALWFMWLAMETLSQKIRKTDMPMLIPIVFFLIMHIVSIFRVPEEQIFGSIQASIVILSCAFFFYFIISYVESERKLYSIVNVMVLSCCLQVIFSIFSFIYYLVVKKVPDLRVEGLLRDYELFAEYLAIHIPLFFFAIRQTKNKKLQFILKCFLAVTIMVLFSTETRGAIISLIIGMGYYLWKMKRVLSVGRIIGMVAAGVLVSVAAYALLAVVVPQSANLIERFQEMDIRSLDTRQVVWESFVDRFRQEPFFGKGVVYDLRSYLFYPHSTYFYYLLTMGIAGLVAYILVVISVLKRGVANLRKAADDPVLYELAIVLNTMLIIFLIDGIKIEYARYSNYQLMIWLIFGLIFVLGSLRRQRSSTN